MPALGLKEGPPPQVNDLPYDGGPQGPESPPQPCASLGVSIAPCEEGKALRETGRGPGSRLFKGAERAGRGQEAVALGLEDSMLVFGDHRMAAPSPPPPWGGAAAALPGSLVQLFQDIPALPHPQEGGQIP